MLRFRNSALGQTCPSGWQGNLYDPRTLPTPVCSGQGIEVQKHPGGYCYRCVASAGGGCGPGFIPSSVRPERSYCPPNQAMQTQQLSDQSWCYKCLDVGIPAEPYSPRCPTGWRDLPPLDCAIGQTLYNQKLTDGSTCYQCSATEPAPGSAQAAIDQQNAASNAAQNAQYQAQYQAYIQQQQQIRQILNQRAQAYNQQVLAQRQAYLNQIQAANAAASTSSNVPPGAVSPGANVQDASTTYPAGLTPPPSVSWKGIGEIVLVLGGAALILNKLGGKKRTGGKRPVHHIEKKETFDVET